MLRAGPPGPKYREGCEDEPLQSQATIRKSPTPTLKLALAAWKAASRCRSRGRTPVRKWGWISPAVPAAQGLGSVAVALEIPGLDDEAEDSV